MSGTPPPPAPPVPSRGRILVVDDEPMIGSAIRRALAKDHDVETVTRASEALARLASGERYDIILSDVMMPEMTGMELYAELQRSYPEQLARTIFMTGGAFTEEAHRFLAELPNLRIDKPFDLQELRALISARLPPRDPFGAREPP